MVHGAVERRANVVGHATVQGHVAANPRNVLDTADGVESHSRLTDDRTTRLQDDPRNGKPQARGGRSNSRTYGLGDLVGGQRIIFTRVGDAPATARTELLEHKTVGVLHPASKVENQPDGLQVRSHLKNLGTDVGVQTN